jgi:hypothetical protein
LGGSPELPGPRREIAGKSSYRLSRVSFVENQRRLNGFAGIDSIAGRAVAAPAGLRNGVKFIT